MIACRQEADSKVVTMESERSRRDSAVVCERVSPAPGVRLISARSYLVEGAT